MDHITESGCVRVHDYEICGEEMYELFQGDPVFTHAGHQLVAEFANAHHDDCSGMCRTHEGIKFCVNDILELYQPPHDCVMFADVWMCRDEIVLGWKSGCVVINEKEICDGSMVDVALQGCVDVDNEWICPTAVGTKHTGYHH